MIQERFYKWRLFQRGGVYYADGRCIGQENLRKYSLGTRDKKTALASLQELDESLAIQYGLTEKKATSVESAPAITKGWEMFMKHCDRSAVTGGVSVSTLKRYRAVRDKHLVFCQERGLQNWSEIDKKATEAYSAYLKKKEYALRTQYLELTLLLQIVKWLIEEKQLPVEAQFKFILIKPQGSETYCYQKEEVQAMIQFCQQDPALKWIQEIIIGLATTGFRIGELATLRWEDIDQKAMTIQLKDERAAVKKQKLGTQRTIKGKRGRSLPLHPSFHKILETMPRTSHGFVYRGPLGGKLKPDVVRRVLVRDVLTPLSSRFPTPDGEIGFQDGRLHSFRHYFVSEAFRQGVTEAQIMDWVGHRDSEMVKLYRHLRQDDSHRNMRQLDFGTEI